MADFLFATWDGGGNVPPALGIGVELKRRGHEVRFIGHPRQQRAIEERGFGFSAYTNAPEWDPTQPFTPPQIALDVFMNRRLGGDVLRSGAADLTVIDGLLFAALEAAQKAGIRHAALTHMFFARPLETWSGGKGKLLALARGFRPPKLWQRADINLVATLRELDPVPERKLTPATVYTGPVWPEGGFPELLDGPPPRHVLVSLSTISQQGQESTLQSVINALAGMDVEATVTTGPAVSPADLRAPANVKVLEYVPHSELMPSAGLLVGHGGHSTTMAALGHGLPMLVIPMSEVADQEMVGRVIAENGAGLTLPKTASAVQIRTALETLLGDGRYRESARRLAGLVRRRNGAVESADRVEALVGRRAASLVSG